MNGNGLEQRRYYERPNGEVAAVGIQRSIEAK